MRFVAIAGVVLSLVASTVYAKADSDATVEIRRTSFGIPHIKANSERGLGFGIGFAYAQDNVCLLAQDVVTARGDRSRYWGDDAKNEDGTSNLESDFFFKWYNTDAAVNAFWGAQPQAIQDLLTGYADGYNHYLAVHNTTDLPASCRAQWVAPITREDLVRVTRKLLIRAGFAQFERAIVAAIPPSSPVGSQSQIDHDGDGPLEALDRFPTRYGSNGVAVGHALSGGGGLLLGNPHFPWSGALRFYQMQLTIPGRLNVMGAALPGLPVINIGFNHDVAWTHTVDTSAHFTLYRLKIDPANPTHYLKDGQSLPLRKTTVTVNVKSKDGAVETKSHDFYESENGPLLSWPGQFPWSATQAFSIRDANQNNTRVLAQWLEIDQARNVEQLRHSLIQTVGIPWVDTVAADANGKVMFANISAIPGLSAEHLKACELPLDAAHSRIVLLDGSRSTCDWTNDSELVGQANLPGKTLPSLVRDDFVQSSNDSAWLANPAEPLVGFPATVSREDVPLGGRSRFALDWLSRRIESGRGVGAQDLGRMVTDNRVFLAFVALDDMLRLCDGDAQRSSHADKEQLAQACRALRSWDRTANTNAGLGYVYFDAAMSRVRNTPDAWAVPFDPAHPVATPYGLRVDDPKIAAEVTNALVSTAAAIKRSGLPENATWGNIQIATRNGQAIPIPGGDGPLGVYNAIESRPAADGRREVAYGSSYMQVVALTPNGPKAQTLLTFSESTDPTSAHFADQTELFSRNEWINIPFTEADIRADAHYRLTVLRDAARQ
ncbi:penicillin acylase family protein [Paraburkholderia tropica]|uniref:bifunctional acylase PvdQ n=1 Tax=Paraburkholderia tropica TaxID=92647 RepID=UPI00080000A9|nr:penicillin acylase family protein [Paraburkholderia tropica]OBR50056.1 hypothetical protein A6456_33850 [Paraburkholderia tropica]